MADVTMPQLGETVTEGTITRWMKSVGEEVSRDEPLFEVSTDKVDSEVPAPASGVLSEILVAEGETVAVGSRLAVISDGAATAPPPPAAAPSPAAAPAPPPAAPPPAAPPPAVVPAPPPPAAAPPPPAVVPAPPPPAAAPPPAVAPAPPPPPPPTGYEAIAHAAAPAAPVAPSPAPPVPGAAPASPAPAPPPPDVGGEGRLLSPVVRRLLEENSISASEVIGTGLGGRITREDVLALVDARRGPSTMAAPASPPPPPPPPPPQAPRPAEPVVSPPPPPPAPATSGSSIAATSSPSPPAPATALVRPATDRVVPFSNMRRRTAEHMLRSKATSPHAFIAYETDFENVERVRREWGDRFASEEGFSLTYLPFIARAVVEGLREFPDLNASVVDDSLVVHQQINLGVAVDLHHEGLIVPVVHRAEEVTLRGLARRIRDLAERARSRQLTADDIAGGTFSITNDGPFGTYFTVPIINQPQVAILATDGIRRRPVVVAQPDGSEALAVHSLGIIGMSWDHRAVDGAYVSSFLRRVAHVLATRDWMAEL